MTQYLLIYNDKQGFDETSVHNAVTTINTLTDWWHYLPNVYILSTDSNSKYIADILIRNFPGLLFFLVKADLNDHNGVLGKDAWDWISKKNRALIKIKPVPPANFDALRKILNPLSQPNPLAGFPPKSVLDILNDRAKRGY